MNNTATARENILSNLRISSVVPDITSRKYPVMEYKRWSLQEKVEQLKQKMEAVHTEVLPCSKSSWGRMFRAVVKEKILKKYFTEQILIWPKSSGRCTNRLLRKYRN